MKPKGNTYEINLEEKEDKGEWKGALFTGLLILFSVYMNVFYFRGD